MFSNADRGWEGVGDVWVLRRYAACAMDALLGEVGLRKLGVRRWADPVGPDEGGRGGGTRVGDCTEGRVVAEVGGVCRVCGGGVAVLDGGGDDGAGKGEERARGATPGRGDRRRRSISAWSCAHSSCFSLYCCFCRRTSASSEVLLSSRSEILSLVTLVASEYASELRRIARRRAAESRRAAN